MRAHDPLSQTIATFISSQTRGTTAGVTAGAIQAHVARPRSSVNRALTQLIQAGRIIRHGAGRGVTYRPAHPAASDAGPSAPSQALLAKLTAPLGTRHPVSYVREFVDRYQPNISHLLPPALATDLFQQGRAKDQLPAGTYARKVLEQLLIDLSWHSSRLEGNRISLLDTRALFEKGRTEADDLDATMLLNHKDAIEFMVDAVPTEGITVPVVRNLQSLLMRDLLPDVSDLGAIRQKIVHIQDSVYLPSQVPGLLEEMLVQVIDKARHVRNPIEAAFFLWVNLAYLQPFVDGNKRTSRLGANLPLMLANCAPLSFIDVEPRDYALAMLGVYEQRDVALAVALFDQTYRRSIAKYQAIVDSMGHPDPMRTRYRSQLGEAMQLIVYDGLQVDQALDRVRIDPQHMPAFRHMLLEELEHLQPYNCARYRLPMGATQAWIQRGRPR